MWMNPYSYNWFMDPDLILVNLEHNSCNQFTLVIVTDSCYLPDYFVQQIPSLIYKYILIMPLEIHPWVPAVLYSPVSKHNQYNFYLHYKILSPWILYYSLLTMFTHVKIYIQQKIYFTVTYFANIYTFKTKSYL